MNTRFPREIGICLIVAMALLDLRCASSQASASQACVSPKTKFRPAHRQTAQGSGERVDSRLVGIWQGFWSLKGKVATDQFLFLQDGRWGWLANADTNATNAVQPVQRSGRWEMADGAVVLTELERKEIVGCKQDAVSDQPSEGRNGCKPCEPEYRTVKRDTAVIERLAIDRCPENHEAIKLDRQYTCLSIGGRVFWRKSLPAKREQERFITGE